MSMTSSLALAVSVMISGFLFLTQVAACDLNPSGCPEFYNYENSFLNKFDQGNYTLEEDYQSRFPSGQTAPNPDEGSNIFVDVFSKLKEWVSVGSDFVEGIVTAVPNALKGTGLPVEVSFLLGAFWYIYNVFLLVLVIAGRA